MYVQRGLGVTAQQIGQAITSVESTPASWNNPGALVSNSWTQSLPGYVGQTPNGIAMFDTPANGQSAMQANIQYYINQGDTLQQMLSAWAPAGAANDPTGLNNPTAYANTVASALGISPTDTLSGADAGTVANAISDAGLDFSVLNFPDLDLTSIGGPDIAGSTVAVVVGFVLLALLAIEAF